MQRWRRGLLCGYEKMDKDSIFQHIRLISTFFFLPPPLSPGRRCYRAASPSPPADRGHRLSMRHPNSSLL
jgi:hypothetical protein